MTLAGCGGGGGGGGGGGPKAISGATFQIVWPDRSRGALTHSLSSARSVAVTLPQADGTSAGVTLNIDRDTSKVGGYTATYTLPGKIYPSKVSTLQAQFYADAGEGGAVVGSASSTATVSGTAISFGTIVMAGTIKSVQALPVTVTVGSASQQLTFSAKDAANDTVAVSAGSAIWSIVSGGTFLTLTPDGIATAVAAGTAQVRATVDGVAGDQAAITVAPKPGPAWMRFHGNAQNTGRAAGGASTTGVQSWVFTRSGTTWSSPAVASDGTVYIGDPDGLQAVSAAGVSKWKFSTGFVASSPAIGSDGTVYFGCKDGKLYAVNPIGTLKWSCAVGSIDGSGPNFGSDGTIYVGSQDGHIYAVNPNGTVKWAHATSDLFASPAVAPDGTIYIGANGATNLYALNPNGSEKWTFSAGDSSHFQSPAVGTDGSVYVTSDNGKLYAFSSAGVKKWETSVAGSSIGVVTSSPGIGQDGTVYVGTLGGEIVAVSASGGVAWRASVGFTQSCPVVGADGTVYTQGASAIDAFTPAGGLKWHFDHGGAPGSLAIGPDGTLYAPTGDSKLYAIK